MYLILLLVFIQFAIICTHYYVIYCHIYISSCLIGYSFQFLRFLNQYFHSKFMIKFLQFILIQIHFSKHNPLCAYNHLFLQYKCLFMNVTTAVNSPHTPLSFVICHLSFSLPTSMNMAMKYLMIHTRVLASLLEKYLSSMNKMTRPVTLMMIPKEVFMINTWV